MKWLLILNATLHLFVVNKEKESDLFKRKKKSKYPSAHPSVLILVFFKDVVDCIQQLFDGTGYVSVGGRGELVINNIYIACEVIYQPLCFISARTDQPRTITFMPT